MQAPHVPRIGERIVIPGDKRENLAAHTITDVIYTPTGKVLLEFDLEGLLVSAEQQVEVITRAGFHEVGDGIALGDDE